MVCFTNMSLSWRTCELYDLERIECLYNDGFAHYARDLFTPLLYQLELTTNMYPLTASRNLNCTMHLCFVLRVIISVKLDTQ